jgi:hypothetical protein
MENVSWKVGCTRLLVGTDMRKLDGKTTSQKERLLVQPIAELRWGLKQEEADLSATVEIDSGRS